MIGVSSMAVGFLAVMAGGVVYLIYLSYIGIRRARASTPAEVYSSAGDADQSSISSAERGVVKKDISLKKRKARKVKKPQMGPTDV